MQCDLTDRQWLSDEADVNDEELACVRMAWQQATERAIDAQMLWGPGVSSELEREFAKVVRVSSTCLASSLQQSL